MTRPWAGALVLACLVAAVTAAPASARWYGSLMQGAPNVNYGCESALIMGPVGGVQLAPTNQVSCTYRHGGYLCSNRPTFIAPGSGRITAVLDVRDKRLRMRIHSSDGVALTAVGPGTVPLQVRDDVGAFNPGIPMAVGYWPFTRPGEPRSADGYSMTGIDLMFQWNFKRR